MVSQDCQISPPPQTAPASSLIMSDGASAQKELPFKSRAKLFSAPHPIVDFGMVSL